MKRKELNDKLDTEPFLKRVVMKEIGYRNLICEERNYVFLYILVFSLYCIFNILRWPVTAGDTDLWYHLSGGRYIFEHHSIPQDSFFSFIEPSRKWIDYYWLFQALVYKIYEYSGYYGLAYLRAFLYVCLMYFVFRYFLRDLYERKLLYFVMPVVASLYALLLLSRYAMIRPHVFSTLLIAVFIYCLEYQRKSAFLLFPLAILWVNIHGVVYPVMLLIVIAYLFETLALRIGNKEMTGKERLYSIVPMILILFSVYCTPYGTRLLGIPLTPTNFASYYIVELQKLTFTDLSSLIFTNFVPSLHTIFVIILMLACFSFIRVVFIPKVRIAHLVLFVGALFLLTKGKRFAFDFILLAMPVIKDALSSLNFLEASFGKEKGILPIKIIIGCFLGIVLLSCMHNFFKNPKQFPISNTGLPIGVTTFLKKVNAGGTVLNNPQRGGYLQWILYPQYKIFMDMEVPFLFLDEDMSVAERVFSDPETFKKMINQYDPSFIVVPVTMKGFGNIVKLYTDYVPVFFDDCEALYVNKKHYPDVANENMLVYIDPLTFCEMSFLELLKHPKLDMITAELQRVHNISPDIGIINRSLSSVFLRRREYRKAIFYADNFIKNYPESDVGYVLKASVLHETGKGDDALENYSIASKKAPENKTLKKAMGMIYFEQKKYRKAYNTLIKAMNIYSPRTTYEDIYYVGYSAAKINAKREALFFLRYGVQMLPAEDKEWNEKYAELQSIITEDHSYPK